MKLTIEPFRLILSKAPAGLVKSLRAKLAIYDNYCKWPKILWTAMLERSNGDLILPRFIPKKFIPGSYTIENKDDAHAFNETPAVRINMKCEPKDELQKDALEYMFDSLNRFKTKIRVLDLPTGSGKTYLALSAAARLSVKACIFVHKITMIETPWIKDILEFTDIKREEICVIQGADSIEKALKHKDKYKVFICVHRTFEVLARRADGEDIIKNMYKELGIGMNIVDEAHKELMSVFYINMLSCVPYTLYLTATLGRVDFKEDAILKYVVPATDTFRCNIYVQDKRFISYCPRTFSSSPTPEWEKKFKNVVGVKMDVYCKYIMANEDVQIALYNGIKTAIDHIFSVNPDAQVAILVGTLEVVQWLYDGLATDYPEIQIGNFTSLIPVKRRIEELKHKIIISTEKSMDSATDSKIDNLILAVPITSDVQLVQVIGRIRQRENHPSPYFVYDVCDVAFPKTKNNFNRRRKVITQSLAKEVITA